MAKKGERGNEGQIESWRRRKRKEIKLVDRQREKKEGD